MQSKRLNRRTLLRGLGGAAVAVPALEIMGARRAEAAPAKRFLVAFAGSSLYRDNRNYFVPDTMGANYDLKMGLAPLGTLGVRDQVSVVSNLRLPWEVNGSMPPGGRPTNFHQACFLPLLCGVRVDASQIGRVGGGPTSDQIVAGAIAGSTRVKNMTYRVQVNNDSGAGGPVKNVMSYARGAGGAMSTVTPKTSPALMYQDLFFGFTPPTGGTTMPPPPSVNPPRPSATLEFVRRRRLSVLDLVRSDSERLIGRLGTTDRIRMEAHFDTIRDLERRVMALQVTEPTDQTMPPPGGTTSTPTGACIVPAAPPPDGATTGAAYNDEDKRAEIIVDFMTLAFACDISRVGSLMFTSAQSGLDLSSVLGIRSATIHDVGHTSDGFTRPREDIARVLSWFVKHFARLVSKFKSTPDTDGTTLLDNSAVVLLFEGGSGLDPQTAGQGSLHSTENMAALIAGGAGGMRQGRHIGANQKHPCSVIVSAMRAVGVSGGLGEVTDHIPELFA